MLEVRPQSARARLRSTSGGAMGGLLDAGLSACSTLLMGTMVITLLPAGELALYSAMFAGFITCALLPTQLAYMPSQLAANTQLEAEPVAPDLIRDLRHNWPIALGSAVVTCLLGLPLIHETSLAAWLAADAGLFLLALASPHQSHARQSLHVAGRHGSAAVVAAVTLAVQACIAAPTVLLPADQRFALLGLVFAGTGVANLVGSALAVVLLRRVQKAHATSAPVRVRLGFLGPDLFNQVVGYLSVLIVVALLGSRTAALLEAARVVASPVQVVVVGLLAFLLPPAVRAVARGDLVAFRARWRVVVLLILPMGAAYAALLLVAAPLVTAALGRNAAPTLSAARAAVMTVEQLGVPGASALLSRHRVGPLNLALLVVNVVQLAVLPPLLLLLGAFGMPAAQMVGSVSKVLATRRLTGRLL